MARFGNKPRLKWALTLILLLAVLPAEAVRAQRVTSEQVADSVHRAVAWLRRRQLADGSWPQASHRGGGTAICLLAMLNAGVAADDPAVVKGIRYLKGVPLRSTYTVSLQCQVYAAADARRNRRALIDAAKFLVDSQNANGMWSYGKRRRGGGDNSNTQFALLGLHEAGKARVPVSRRVWQLGKKHFINTQHRAGGWGYRGRGGQSYGSMTVAGIASLYICGQRLTIPSERVFRNGAYPGCGKYTRNRALTRGLEWITKNFTVQTNPGRKSWYYYYLYGLERVGMISGMRAFGTNDWYRMGAAELVARQSPAGNWGSSKHTYQTAFALLFLAKGNRPVIIQKVQWPGRWNRNIHDLENLTSFMGEKLGRRTTWQTTSLAATLHELRTSPILLITGHKFPDFTEAETQKLRRFVSDAGGTLLFEACCGSGAFAEGFRRFAGRAWGDYPLRALQKDHPIFSCVLPVGETYGLEGIDIGCRTGVFFSPRALSCLWELRTIPKYSQLAFELGTNLAAYATGGDRLADKLDVVELPAAETPEGPRRAEAPRGAIRVARLIHDGKYDVGANTMINLAAMLRDQAGIDVVARSRHVRATDRQIYEYPIVFMTGLYKFKLPPAELKALRAYLEKGGLLMVNNGCGRVEFQKSFREMVKQLFPENPLTPLLKDHPIYTGKTGLVLGEVLYRPMLAKQLKQRGTTTPPLEAVTIDGRTVILYSKYDFGCALEGVRPYASRGYLKEGGRRLAMCIFLYAIGY